VSIFPPVLGIEAGGISIMTKRPPFTLSRKPILVTLRLLVLAAVALTFNHSIALADDGMPIEGFLAASFTQSQTSPGIVDILANGIGKLTNVGNFSFQLHKTIDRNATVPVFSGTFTITAKSGDTLTGTYTAVTSRPDSGGFGIITGQLAVTGGTGRFQSASGFVPFTSVANGGPGLAVYSFKGVLHM
jgi:hypothetical protein